MGGGPILPVTENPGGGSGLRGVNGAIVDLNQMHLELEAPMRNPGVAAQEVAERMREKAKAVGL